MNDEDFLVFLICQIFVGMNNSPKETSELLRCVRGTLWWGRGEGGVANEIYRMTIVGAAAVDFCGRRASSTKTWQCRDFDSTRGYPGEDIVF